MTSRTPPVGLRAARSARGWSQADAARELGVLGLRRGAPVAAAASLKTLLSRWENGHSHPDPQYRLLLGELFERTPAELGLDPPAEEGLGATGAERLRAAVAAAAAVTDPTVDLWWRQLAAARGLDDELGAAGAAGVVTAQLEQLEHTCTHALSGGTRRAVAAVLAGAATLAGAQALDGAAHDEAWRLYHRARTAAGEAGSPAAAAVALAGQATVLIDAGDPGSALALLDDHRPEGPVEARIRWEAAVGTARAAAGDAEGTSVAFVAAERLLRQPPGASGILVDAAAPVGLRIEMADVHRWHGRALVTLGAGGAVPPLEKAMAAGPRSVRQRAGLHADLATALAVERPDDAARHAREARALATRIGSRRITALLVHQDDR